MSNKAENLAINRTAIDMKIITKIPLMVCKIGSTTKSETLFILSKTDADKSLFLFWRKNSYCWDNNFLRANSDKSLQIVAFSFNCFERTYNLIKDANQLVNINVVIKIKILYFGSKSKNSLRKTIDSLGCPLKKLNNLARILKLLIALII